MKKILAIIIVAILALSTAFAVNTNGVGSPDNECRNNGFEFGIVKWDWNGEGYSVSAEGVRIGYSVGITGNAAQATWTSAPAVAGALEKESTSTFAYPGGTTGIISKGDHDISHITLCGNAPRDNVPEFTVLGAIVLLGLAGLFIARKRN